jgi:hypothetical protein
MLQCGSGPSSTFESHDDLEKWGWERMEHEQIDQFRKPLVDAMNYLEVGSTKDQAWSITEKHTKLKVVDGKRYAPTQGSYGLTYTAEFVSADNNWGPRSEGPDQVPQVDGVYLPFPLLEKLSDVAFLVFQQLMKETKQPMDQLKGLLRSGVVNSETLLVTTNALRLKPDAPHPAWPGRDFGPQSEGFAAILASPNGRGVAWFLAQHKAQLGHKTISNVRVWGEEDEVFILFVFEDVSDSDENETSAEEVTPQEISSIQASGKDRKAWEAIQCKLFGLFCISKASNGQRDLEILSRGKDDPQSLPVPQFPNRKKPKVKIDWDRWVDKGKSYQELLRCGLKDSKWKSYDDLTNNGWKKVQELSSAKIHDNGGMRKAMDFLKISSKPEDQWSVAQQHLVEKTIDGKTYFPTAAMYDNKYNMELITAENNFGPRYKGPEQADPPVTGDPNPFPELQQLSDVVYLEFARLMKQSKNPLNKLKGVLRGHVINAETRAIAAKAVGLSATKLHDKSLSLPGRDFDAGSDEFAAFIASPNGRAVVWLLATHADLGPKIISSVKVYDDEGLWILYVFEDRETNPGHTADDKNEPSTRKGLIAAGQEPSTNDTLSGLRESVFSVSPRNARRLDEPGSQNVNDAKSSGRFLVMAQDSSTEILESCLNIKQSTFLQSKQLSDSGWKLMGDHETTLDEDSDAAMFNSWHDMNLDLSADANHAIEYQHLEKTTALDGTVYYPSGAYYKNVFSEGGIAAKDNASPWKTGANMNPLVDGKTKPFPPLKQWSDAVFLAYKDVCKSDPMKMKNLKGCLRHNVINIAARQILSEYMGKHGELDSGRPKPWPGTMYKLDEDGFNVALGVPNGKGVAYLLATHRESLGWKEIYQIRIFSVGWDSSYNILYYIRDHKEDSQRRHALSEVALARTIQSRALSDEAYEKAQKKGSNLLCQLYASASSVKGSIWKDPQALEDYGWVASDPEYKWDYNAPDNDIGPALKDLGVSTDAFDNIKYGYWHQKESKHDGHTYPATFGFYQNVFNVKAGVIVADSNFGPDYEKRFGMAAETVPLKQYSDVVFLAWQKQAGDNIKNLKYVFRHKIVNPATQNILNAVLEKRNEKLQTWPGTKISMIESDARAILGTSNGHGVAYLLAQHKEQLGVKVIDSVTIFESDHLMSLCFWIVDEDDGGASLQPSTGSTVESRDLHKSALRPDSEHESDLLPQKAHSAWTKVLAKRFGKVAEACWAAFRVA